MITPMQGTDTRFIAPLDPQHDRRHHLQDTPHARESLIGCGLKLPDDDVKVAVYTWVDGAGKAGLSISAYGPRVGPTALQRRFDDLTVPASMGFDSWDVGPLLLRQRPDPFSGMDFTVNCDDIGLEYSFEAMHPPFAYGINGEDCPDFLATERFEQAGYVRGTLTLRGEKIPFETVAHRDHSWGTRDWGVPQHWKWIEAQSEDGAAVHVFEIFARGRTWLYGYVFKDNTIAKVEQATISVDNDASMDLRSIEATILDNAGRTTNVRGQAFANYEFPVHPLATCMEGSMTVEIDSMKAVGHIEQLWPAEYLRYLRNE